MYRVLVIDDEPIIADGIFEIVSSMEEHELEVYKVYSAYEALDLMNRMKLDIVISDICMPKMSGLEFMELVKDQWPNCKLIFLSGHNEFEYVQSALRKDVVDFILKNEGNERIIHALSKAVTEIENDISEKQFVEDARRQMDLAIPLLQQNFLLDLLEGLDCPGDERQKQFRELGIPLNHESPVLLILGRIDRWPENPGFAEKMEIIYGVQNIVEKHLNTSLTIVPVVFERAKLMWLIQPVEEADSIVKWEKTVSLVQGSMDTVQKSVRETFHTTVSFVVCNTPVSWRAISDKFDTLKLILGKTAGVGTEVLLTDLHMLNFNSKYEDVDGEEYNVRLQLKKMDILQTYLEYGQKEEFIDLCRKILGVIKINKHAKYGLAREVYFAIALTFMSYLNLNKQAERIGKAINIEKLMKIEEHASWEECTSYFLQLAELIFEQKTKDFISSNDRFVENIHRYIHQNLSGDLTLTRLADISHFNPAYMARLYRQMTGKSLTDYISEVKLIKARELLRNSDIRIEDITAQLGFTSQSYFAKFFRKLTKMSPREYREMNQK